MRNLSILALALIGALAASVAEAASPTPAQQSAIKAACPSDFQANCPGVSPGGQAALACLEKNVAKLSAPCQTAVNAVIGGGAAATTAPAATAPAATTAPATTTAPAATAPAATTPPPVTIVLTPRQELRLVRVSCGGDFQTYCGNVVLGGGRALACLVAHGPQLSATCQGAIKAAGQRF